MQNAANHIMFFAAIASAAAVFALLEIQIEGDSGWARSLPTWRIENRWTKRFLGARAITGYHVYFQLFLLILVHLPFVIVPDSFSLRLEARVLAFLLWFWVLEDYLWFVFNPSFGARKFRASHAWWHAPNWWWIMPRDYWIFTPIAATLYWWSWVVS